MAYPVIVASFLGTSSELTCTRKGLYLGSQGVAVVKAVREHLAYGSMSIDRCCAATTNVRRAAAWLRAQTGTELSSIIGQRRR